MTAARSRSTRLQGARLSGTRIPVGLISVAFGLAIWEVGGRVSGMSYLPAFSDVVRTLVEMVLAGQIVANLAQSLGNLGVGLVVSISLGILVGSLMGLSRRADAALSGYVYGLLTAPSLVFAPILFSIFGTGRASIVGVIVMHSTFIIMINTAAGISGVSPAQTEMARVYGANRWQTFVLIVIPAATPMIMAGLRLGVGRAVTGMINGEMFISVVGLGRVLTLAGRQFDGAAVMAVLSVVIGVALVCITIVNAVDRRLTRWLPVTAR